MHLMIKFLICLYFTFSILIDKSFVNSDPESNSQNDEVCSDRNFILISTVNGAITALDLNTGQKCWSVVLDSKKFLSSSLSEFEIYENGRRVFLVPSFDGGLYRYDSSRKIIQPMPVDVDYFISHSAFLDSSTIITGGKMKIIHGIHRLTGEVIYTCQIDSCNNSKNQFPENILVVEEIIQSVNAIDTNKGEKKWHFRVVELKIRLASQVLKENSSAFKNDKQENALVPQNFNDITNLDIYKVSLQRSFAAMLNKTTHFEFSWLHKADCPINDAWYLKGDAIKELDLFEKESGFFSVDMEDGKHPALLFLGSYENQMFVKRSRKAYTKNKNFNPPSRNVLYHSYLSPVCPKVQNKVTPYHHSVSAVTELVLNNKDYNVTENGVYFYVNYSVAENSTHCMINASYILHYDDSVPMSYWIIVSTISFCVASLVTAYCLTEKKRDYVTASTSCVTVAPKLDVNFEFKSRFHQEFELISILGKGGFGVVMDVKHKIDDCRYAVKRIRVNKDLDMQYERVLREVKALAKLDHHGIVRYFNAWIEYPPLGWQENKDIESNICDISLSTSYSDDSEITTKSKVPSKHNKSRKLNQNPFKPFDNNLIPDSVLNVDLSSSSDSHSSSSDIKEPTFRYYHHDKSKKSSSKISDDDSDSSIQFQRDNSADCLHESYSSTDPSYDDDINKFTRSRKISVQSSCSYRNEESKLTSSSKQESKDNNSSVTKKDSVKEVCRGYLYIQMQLCQKESLRDWLDRNGDNREYNKVMEIFSEIVDAVHYVHKCGLMHRDLKPSNIYFSLEGAIKVGDFGLATSSEPQVENEISNNKELSDIHTSDIGTEIYMSPEQKRKQDYDFKTDIYSLGIIFFELLVPFNTYSERCKILIKVRQLQFPKDFERTFHNESQFVQLLLHSDPTCRPTTDEIKNMLLNHLLL